MTKIKPVELTDARIIKFYQANPGINPEAVNLLFIELIEKLFVDTNSVIHSHIMHTINENTNDIKNALVALNDTVKSANTENNLNLFSKITDIKNDYINELKRAMETSNNTVDNLSHLLDKNNLVLLDKTSNVLNEIVPKSQTHIQSQINDTLQQFHKSLCVDTSNLIKSTDTHSSIKDFVQNFEIKTSMMLQTLQQPIYSFITASEERITTNMNAIKEGNSTHQISQQKIMGEIEDFLKNFRANKSNTQVLHNNQLSGVLTKMYNSAEIHIQPSVMNSGSILLKRLRKPNIIIENKDSTDNIGVDEINNFMLLVEEHNCNGIFISQNSGISNKKNYQIEFVNNNIVVFLHSVEYCSTRISSAVDIIDNLTMKLRLFKDTFKSDDISIPKDILDSINSEYQLFMNQKNSVIEVMKDSQKKMISQLDELRFPYLDKFLSTKYSMPVQKAGLKCDVCKLFNANNLKALAAHKRGCNRKNVSSIAAGAISSSTSTASTSM